MPFICFAKDTKVSIDKRHQMMEEEIIRLTKLRDSAMEDQINRLIAQRDLVMNETVYKVSRVRGEKQFFFIQNPQIVRNYLKQNPVILV